MRIAIIYEDNNVWIEFSPEKFRQLLKDYFEKYKSVDLALDEIILELKRETLKK